MHNSNAPDDLVTAQITDLMLFLVEDINSGASQ